MKTSKNIEEEDKLKKEAPTLASLKKKGTPPPPAGYFNKFPGKVMDKIREEENQPEKGKILPVWRSLAAAAAVIIFVLSISPVYFAFHHKPTQDNNNLASVKEISNDAVLNMVDEDDIIDQLSSEKAATITVAPNQEVKDTTSTNAIINYLMDENVSTSAIMESL